MESDSDKENDDVPEFLEVTDEVPAKFMDSRRGRPQLVDPYNYIYSKMKDVKDRTYWRCVLEVSKLYAR
jgi:hypothetical protein